MPPEMLSTRAAANRSDNLISSEDFARLARRGKIIGAVKLGSNWELPVTSVDEYISLLATPKSVSQRLVQWWDRTSRVPKITVILLITGLVTNGIDFFLNVQSLFDLLAPGVSLYIDKAKDDEILILVTEFAGQGSYAPTPRIYRALDEAVKQRNINQNSPMQVKVRQVPNRPTIREDAIALGTRYKASIVIWGTFDDAAIEPSMEVLRKSDFNYNIPELGKTINEDQRTYNLYLAEGLPSEFEYLTFLVVAKTYMFRKDFEQAVLPLTSALESNTSERSVILDIDEVYALRGQVYHYLHDVAAAEQDYSMALKLNSDNLGVYNNWAILKFQQDRQDEAVALCDKGLSIQPNSWLLYQTKGIVYYYSDKYQNAIEAYTSAIKYVDDNDAKASILVNRGVAYASIEQWDQARSDYRLSKKLNDRDSTLFHNWGDLELNTGNPEIALEYFELSLQYGSTDHRTTQSRGVAYRNMGEYAKARADFEYVISIAPEYGGGHYEMGVLESLEGNYLQAEQYLKKAAKIWPDNVRTYEQLALVLTKLNKWKELASIITTLIDIKGESPDYIVQRGMIYLNSLEYLRAENDFKRAKELLPQSPLPIYGTGVVSLMYRAEITKAITEFNAAITLQPNFPDAYLMRGIAFAMQGDYQAANDDCNSFKERPDFIEPIGPVESCWVKKVNSSVIFGVTYLDGIQVIYK